MPQTSYLKLFYRSEATAMIEHINLIPDEIRERKEAGQKRPLIIIFLIFYFFGLGAVYFYQKAKINGRLDNLEQIKKQNNELIAQNTRYKEAIERIGLVQKKEEDIKKRLEVIDSILQGRIYWSGILRGITHIIPDGIWLTSLSTYDLTDASKASAPRAGQLPAESIRGKGVKVTGTALSNSRIAEFIFAIENSQFFGNVLLAYSQKRELQGKDLYDFEITADLKERIRELGN